MPDVSSGIPMAWVGPCRVSACECDPSDEVSPLLAILRDGVEDVN